MSSSIRPITWLRFDRAALALALIATLCGPAQAARQTTLVSRGLFGVSANGQSISPSLSKNGRYVAFESAASDLVPGDTNGAQDVFVRDRKRGTIERISVSSNGVEANGGSGRASISGNGRLVVFESAASNLDPWDGNGLTDIFIHDRRRGTTARVSISSFGGGPNATCLQPSISGNGAFVAFHSSASNLVAGDTNATHDIFVRHLEQGVTRRVSVSSRGDQGNGSSTNATLSWDGRYVVFISSASNLMFLEFNGFSDTFVHDMHTGQTLRISDSGVGAAEGNGHSFGGYISANGRFVYFVSAATNLVAPDLNGVNDVFLADLARGDLTMVSVSSHGVPSDNHSSLGGISRDGRYAVFRSSTNRLVPGDTNGSADAFLFNRKRSTVRRFSLASNGDQANGTVFDPSISANGKIAAFDSVASNLVRRDQNGLFDVFVRRLK